jgi:hypothetical protein
VAYDATEWHDLFVASAGATAALAGLVFVAVSINLERILRYEGLPERGLETVMLLVGSLVVSIICLIPGQSHLALGLELLGTAALFVLALGRVPIFRPSAEHGGAPLHVRLEIRYAGVVLFSLGGLSLVAAAGGGLYWVVAGVLVATLAAVVNAWVLLVEIMR